MNRFQRFAVLAAPALLLAYGLVRLLDGADGEHGPGPAWTIGHLLFLTGFILYAVVVLAFRRLAGSGPFAGPVAGPVAGIATAVALVGVAAFLRVIVIDLIVGFRAPDHAAMRRIGDEYDRWPGDLGLYETLYDVGPLLFLAGLLTLAIQLVVRHRLPVWSPVLLVSGFVLITINLDLMPLGAAALLAAVLPATSNRSLVASSARRG